MSDAFSYWLLITGVFLVAGLVKGVTGMGLPTVAMGLLGSIMSPATAAAMLLIPSFITNFWQLIAGPAAMKVLRRFWSTMVGIVVGTTISTRLLVSADPTITRVALGAALVAYALYALKSPKFSISPAAERWLSPVIGLVTGAITGVTGVFAIPAVPYYQALNLEKNDLVQALGLSFTVSTVALAAGLLFHGAFVAGGIGISTVAVLPALIGMWLGQVIRARISAQVFRLIFLLFLLTLGLEMIVRSLF